MTSRFIPPMAVLAATLLVAGPAIAQEEGSEEEMLAVVEGFSTALAAGDSTAALGFLHPDLVVYEGGHAEDLAAYRAGHLAADMEFAQAVGFDVVEEDLVTGPGMAFYTSEYTMAGTFRGREIDAHGVETIVLVPTDAGWRIRHIHWSSR